MTMTDRGQRWGAEAESGHCVARIVFVLLRFVSAPHLWHEEKRMRPIT